MEYVEKILEVDDLGFLKEIESSQKLKVIQINRNKYKAAREYFSSLQPTNNAWSFVLWKYV